MSDEETLYIKDGIVGRMYRLYCADESNYDHVATHIYRVTSEGRVAGYGTVCDDETFLLLAKRTVPIISIDLVLVMLTDGTTGYINQFNEAIEYITL